MGANPPSPPAPKTAQIRPAKGNPPEGENARGIVLPMTDPAPKGAPTNPPRLNNDSDFEAYRAYVATIKPEEIRAESLRLLDELKQIGKFNQPEDYQHATLIKDKLAVLKEKANAVGLHATDVPELADSSLLWEIVAAIVAASKVGKGRSGAYVRKWSVPKNVRDKIPKSWGESKPNKKTKDGEKMGERWADPENPKGNRVRIDQGNPNSPYPSQQVDHVVVQSNGKVIGRDGKPIIGSISDNYEQAHIPLSEYSKWKTWNSPN